MYLQGESRENKERAIYSSFPILIFSVLGYLAFLLLLNRFFSFPSLPLVILFGLTNKAVDYYCALSRGLGYSFSFSLSGMIYALAVTIINIILIIGFQIRLPALFISNIAAFLLQVLFLEIRTRVIRNFRFNKINLVLTKRMLKYAGPFCINVAAYWILSRYSRIVISRSLNLSQNGLYAVATGVTTLLTLLARNFLLSWQEAAFSKTGGTEERARYFSLATNTFIKILSILFVLMIPIIGLLFPFFIGSEYQGAKPYIPLALLGVLLYSLDLFLGSLYGNLLENRIVVLSTLLGALLCLATLNFFVALLGVNGASLAICLGFGTSAVLKSFFLFRKIRLKIDILRTGFYAALILAVSRIYLSGNYLLMGIFLLFFAALSIFLLRPELRQIISAAKTGKKNSRKRNKKGKLV